MNKIEYNGGSGPLIPDDIAAPSPRLQNCRAMTMRGRLLNFQAYFFRFAQIFGAPRFQKMGAFTIFEETNQAAPSALPDGVGALRTFPQCPQP